MPRKNNLKLVDAEQQEAERRRKDWEKVKPVYDEHTRRRREASIDSETHRAILADYLDDLEDMSMDFFVTLPFLMLGMLQIGFWERRRSVVKWVGELRPEIAVTDGTVEKIVDAAGDQPGTDLDPALCEIYDDYATMKTDLVETAFILGIIAGAKMAGYTREKLDKVADMAANAIP